jgi:ADP-heptose:LPS heptosyltransferase
MPRALFTSKNLIGDAMYIQPALKRWSDEHPDWDIDLLTLNDHITCLYEGMGIPRLRIIFEREVYIRAGEPDQPCVEYDFEFEFKVNIAFSLGDMRKIHISQAYMSMLGYEVDKPQAVEYDPGVGDYFQPEDGGRLVLLSMFSNSCASREGKPPNKMLSWSVWHSILTLVRQWGSVRVLGGPKDFESAPLAIKPEEYLTGKSLPYIARTMRSADLLITIDNGMSHLAASMRLPIILFYPKCLGTHWIIPSGHSRLVVYHIDPMTLDAVMGEMAIREGIKSLFKGEQHEETNQESDSEEDDWERQIETEASKAESVREGEGGVVPGGHGSSDDA